MSLKTFSVADDHFLEFDVLLGQTVFVRSNVKGVIINGRFNFELKREMMML